LNPSKNYNTNLLIKNDILSTLAYYDIFTYPLRKREIWLFLQNLYDHTEFEIALQALVDNSSIFKLDEYYSLQNTYAIVNRRITGNDKARQLLQTAEKVTSLLSGFPFVRGIAVSGSLSKNFADDRSDIDLFIITSPNRLWVARTLLHCFKKLTFLVNKQHFFCMNYFVDEDHLEIAEKNIYTATEIATLIPLQGNTIFEKFYTRNAWIKMYLPNKYMRVSTEKKIKETWLKWLIEFSLNNSFGNMMDNMLMNITSKRWLKKTNLRKLNTRGIILGMSASKSCAKPDPKNFQSKFIDQYERKVFELLHKKVIVMKSAN
jgi:predicted nucleotidyltransferase